MSKKLVSYLLHQNPGSRSSSAKKNSIEDLSLEEEEAQTIVATSPYCKALHWSSSGLTCYLIKSAMSHPLQCTATMHAIVSGTLDFHIKRKISKYDRGTSKDANSFQQQWVTAFARYIPDRLEGNTCRDTICIRFFGIHGLLDDNNMMKQTMLLIDNITCTRSCCD